MRTERWIATLIVALRPRRRRENDMSNRTAGDGEPRAAEPTPQNRSNPTAADVERPAAQRGERAEADETERSAADSTGPADSHETQRGAGDDDRVTAPNGAHQRRSGQRPEGPAHARKGSAMQTLKRIWSEFSEDNLTDSAAALTYYAILSIFPALLALVAIVGLVGDPHTVTKEMTTLVSSIGPASAAQTFKGPIEGLTKSSGTAGILLILGIASALWTASGYVGAFMRASNVIYEVEEGRSVIKRDSSSFGGDSSPWEGGPSPPRLAVVATAWHRGPRQPASGPIAAWVHAPRFVRLSRRVSGRPRVPTSPRACGGAGWLREVVARRPWMTGGMGTEGGVQAVCNLRRRTHRQEPD